jgi:hypothetical protein
MCYVAAQVFRYPKTLMSTYPFLYRVYGRHHIRWRIFPFPGSIPSRTRRRVCEPCFQEASASPPRSRDLCTGVSQIVLAGSSLLTSGRSLYRVHSWHLVRSCPRARPVIHRQSAGGAAKGTSPRAVYQLRGVALRLRLLRVTHILGCAQLGQFVQQFLTRLVIAHAGRPNSQCVSELDPPWFPDFHTRLYLISY